MTLSPRELTHPIASREAITFAVVSTWPDTKNAEYEVLERLIRAGQNLNCDVLTIDNDGRIIASTRADEPRMGSRVTADICQFVISLHFQSPRLYDVHSYITLWNPPEFLHVFGYEASAGNMSSHTDVLSCHSDIADLHADNLFRGLGRALPLPLPPLFHSLPKPYLEPKVGPDSKLFYIGINWERISGTRGRHHDLLERLDAEDLINIYGPEEFHGVKPWGGFKTYRGEIPFDGRSVVVEANKSGICLAFSSAAHQRSGIMSNRLFEGLAAGTVVIANPHPFISKYFADCVYIVDDRLSSQEICEQVRDIVQEVRRNPAAALERARLGQRRLAERFSLDGCLQSLLDGHAARAEAYRAAAYAKPANVGVILFYAGTRVATLAGMLDNVARQVNVTTRIVVLCGESFGQENRSEFDAIIERAQQGKGVLSVDIITDADPEPQAPGALRTRGARTLRALDRLGTEYLCLMECDEHWFSDHVTTLVQALNRTPDAFMAASGKIREDSLGAGTSRRTLETVGFTAAADVIEASYAGDAGRFLFRSELVGKLPPALMPLLDGCEARALGLWALTLGPVAVSNYASFVAVQELSTDLPVTETPDDEQIETIRDSVRGSPVWMERRSQFSARGHVGRVRLPHLELNKVYNASQGGDGVPFLRTGFSPPEAGHVWIDGLTGKLEFMMPSGQADATLSLQVVGRSEEGQFCTVVANGKVIISGAKVDEKMTELVAPLPPVSGAMAGKMTVTVKVANASQVRNEEGKVVDPRYLGLHLVAFSVFDRTRPAPLKHGRIRAAIARRLARAGKAISRLT